MGKFEPLASLLLQETRRDVTLVCLKNPKKPQKGNPPEKKLLLRLCACRWEPVAGHRSEGFDPLPLRPAPRGSELPKGLGSPRLYRRERGDWVFSPRPEWAVY